MEESKGQEMQGGGSGQLQVGQSYLHPWECEQILQTICRHIKDETITRSIQHGFREGKSCLTNLINFCDEVTGLVDEVRAAYIVYLDFSKVHPDHLYTWTLTFSLVRYS